MSKPTSGRVAGIDVARALAALVMLQGHATDAWVAPAHEDAIFRASRLLGTFPLPAFLLLAGTSVAWRVATGEERGESPAKIGRSLSRRGLGLVVTGYLVSLASALLDGTSADFFLSTVLRADVLHVIGASIAIAGVLVPRRTGYAAGLVRRCAALGVVVTAVCPLLPAFDVPLGVAAALGLFFDAAPITRMPVVPLFAWFAAGTLCAALMRASTLREDKLNLDSRSSFTSIAGATPQGLVVLALLAFGAIATGWLSMSALHEAFGGALNRQHVAVLGNVLDLTGRGALVLVAGAAIAPFLPPGARHHLVLLGRGSLTAYVIHLPFTYGRFGGPFRDSLTSGQALVGIVVLAFGTYAFVRLWPMLRRSLPRPHRA